MPRTAGSCVGSRLLILTQTTTLLAPRTLRPRAIGYLPRTPSSLGGKIPMSFSGSTVSQAAANRSLLPPLSSMLAISVTKYLIELSYTFTLTSERKPSRQWMDFCALCLFNSHASLRTFHLSCKIFTAILKANSSSQHFQISPIPSSRF